MYYQWFFNIKCYHDNHYAYIYPPIFAATNFLSNLEIKYFIFSHFGFSTFLESICSFFYFFSHIFVFSPNKYKYLLYFRDNAKYRAYYGWDDMIWCLPKWIVHLNERVRREAYKQGRAAYCAYENSSGGKASGIMKMSNQKPKLNWKQETL